MSTYEIRHHIAIAEIVIFSLPLLPRIRWLGSRLSKDHPDISKIRRIARLYLAFSWDLICFFCLARIIGNAFLLSAKSPSSGLIIGAAILQSIGSSPLLAELSVALVQCITSNARRSTSSRLPRLRAILLYIRIPIVLAIILFVVGIAVRTGAAWTLALAKAASIILMLVFVGLVSIVSILMFDIQLLCSDARSRLFVASASLPFLFVRVLYVVLAQFRGMRFNPLLGDWRALVGMGFAMEAVIVGVLMYSRMKETHIGSSRIIELEDITSRPK